MKRSSASALVTDNGRKVLLRLRGRFYEVTQEELRIALGLPAAPPGLGITIDGERLHLEFPADNQQVEIGPTPASLGQERYGQKLIIRLPFHSLLFFIASSWRSFSHRI